ncbi:MAG: ParB/RepB/Spo0J family partition protein [Syntrophobacteraceae bacterium]|nr:ParB/RepB/Spo0J family partition protein [Syntrophobacteraceae bacterium]
MADKRRGLGRGLQELLSSTDWLRRNDIQLFFCPIDQLDPNPHQPRQVVEDEELQEMAQSMREKGVLQPILVVRAEVPERYRILAGERRWRAARLAGLEEIPVLLREAGSDEALEIALIENIQRRDLNCIEEALAYKRLRDEFHLTQEEIAKRVGKDRSTVANLLRLLQLPNTIQGAVLCGNLSMGHARAILGLDEAEDQEKLLRLIAEKHLSVRQAENLVASWTTNEPARVPPSPDRELSRLQESLRAHLGTRVLLKRRGERGTITIPFPSQSELERILAILGMN